MTTELTETEQDISYAILDSIQPVRGAPNTFPLDAVSVALETVLARIGEVCVLDDDDSHVAFLGDVADGLVLNIEGRCTKHGIDRAQVLGPVARLWFGVEEGD